jgi:transposase
MLLPHLADVQVEEVSLASGMVRIAARARALSAACPRCETVSRRVHGGWYERRLLDMAIAGREVSIRLSVRRFLCLSPECPKATFAEHVSGLTSRYARSTPAVTAVLEAVALPLGGRAGARMSGRLSAAVSRRSTDMGEANGGCRSGVRRIRQRRGGWCWSFHWSAA